ncbi:hypothetical protein DTO271G3_7661 [Paecilomyces variotii]|nr:hypothetical protein DTO271G3_7661 [Paecilomyces variotii]
MWFVKVCKENVDHLISRKGQDGERPDHIARAKQLNSQPPLNICWQYYQNLLQQQDEVLYSKRDEEAFVFGLKQFPALKRVTITPAAHGWLYNPLYETPMIRAFPSGFDYPIPRGSPISDDLQMLPFAELWEDMTEKEKEQWRGFRIITRALAQVEHNTSELIFDVNQLPTGLNCTIFNSPCEEYNNLVKILAKPGFRRLDLSLIVGGQEHFGWPAFRNGYIRRALSQAKDLEQFSLWTTLEAEPGASLRSTVPGGGGSMAHFIPLQSVFPVSEWPNLQQFHLSRFIVTQSDLIKLLRDLSPKIRTISLNFLPFFDNGGNYHSLLTEIREKFGWHERDMTSRPRLIIGLTPQCPWTGFRIWIEKEVHAFLYENDENPFRAFSDTVSYGTGLVRDSFEDEHERPNVLPFDLAKMGISKPIPEHVFGR